MAAPVVIGTLLSRPVLGAPYHNCTISGQMSGNVSTHEQGDCSISGNSPSYYAGTQPSSWPDATTDFLNGNGDPRNFKNTPYSQSPRFSDAYEKEKIAGNDTANNPIGEINPASVWDVLAGFVVNTNTGGQNSNRVLRAKSGFVTDLALGQEAVAAYMNAFDQTKFPITKSEVVAMFNAVVVTGGIYDPLGVNWDASQVLTYFRSLHS